MEPSRTREIDAMTARRGEAGGGFTQTRAFERRSPNTSGSGLQWCRAGRRRFCRPEARGRRSGRQVLVPDLTMIDSCGGHAAGARPLTLMPDALHGFAGEQALRLERACSWSAQRTVARHGARARSDRRGILLLEDAAQSQQPLESPPPRTFGRAGIPSFSAPIVATVRRAVLTDDVRVAVRVERIKTSAARCRVLTITNRSVSTSSSPTCRRSRPRADGKAPCVSSAAVCAMRRTLPRFQVSLVRTSPGGRPVVHDVCVDDPQGCARICAPASEPAVPRRSIPSRPSTGRRVSRASARATPALLPIGPRTDEEVGASARVAEFFAGQRGRERRRGCTFPRCCSESGRVFVSGHRGLAAHYPPPRETDVEVRRRPSSSICATRPP